MLDDPELAGLFQVEAEEHLQNLDRALLHLEASPLDYATLDEAFRSAHSLKGAAGMMGVEDLQRVAHHFEDVLGTARKGAVTLRSDVVDVLYRQLDAMRALVGQAITGIPAGVAVAEVLALLSGVASGAPPAAVAPAAAGVGQQPAALEALEDKSTEPKAARLVPAPPLGDVSPVIPELTGVDGTGVPLLPFPAPQSESASTAARSAAATSPPAAPVAPPGADGVPTTTADAAVVLSTPAAQAPSAAASRTGADPAKYQITTVRVETERLDDLMRQTGELNVTRVRIARRVHDLNDLLQEWEGCLRESALQGRALGDLARGRATSPDRVAALAERLHASLEQAAVRLRRLNESAQEDYARLQFVTDELEDSIRSIRLLPLSTVFTLFHRTVRDIGREQEKEVQLAVEGGETAADKRILEEIKDPLMHLIRNAVDHGVETPEDREKVGKPRSATIRLRASSRANLVVIEVSDDGRGVDLEAIRRTALRRKICTEAELAAMTPAQVQMLIFAPGFSTRTIITDISGRGVGMDVVRNNVERLKGSIRLDSRPGAGCTVRLELPVTLSTTQVLIAEVAGRPYAVPVDYVEITRLVSPREIFAIEGRDTLLHEGAPISVARLEHLLELPEPARRPGDHTDRGVPRHRPCMILVSGEDRFGVLVDQMLDEQEVVLKPLGSLLKRVRNVSGATILGTGEVCVVLNPADLARTVRRMKAQPVIKTAIPEAETMRTLLLADDSITTRMQEKRILESAGYRVVTAVDGLDAWNKLQTGRFDGVVSDVEMPNMTGLQFTARLRQEAVFRDLPVILVTSLSSDEDRRRGIEVGANAYLTKPTFDQRVLLETLERLI